MKIYSDDKLSIYNVITNILHELLDDSSYIDFSIELTLKRTSVPGEANKDKCDCELK